MSYSLNTIVINSKEEKKPKNAVILCHGYGGDGKDISVLANYWKNFLEDTVFLCPDGPEICAVNENGYQWFDLMDQSKDEILTKSLIAENKLNIFIEEIKEKFSLQADKICIGGFSQGCMITIQTGLKRQDNINSIFGYSGKIIDISHLEKNLVSRPNIILLHGDKDEVVPPSFLLEAKQFFEKNNFKIKTKIFKNCEHRIPTEGLSLGLDFIKKNLY